MRKENKRNKIISTVIFGVCVLILSVVLVIQFNNHQNKKLDDGNDIAKYGMTNSSLVYYSDFDKALDYLNNSKETEVLYLGRASCQYCLNYVPAVNNAMIDFNKPMIYVSTEKIQATVTDENGVVKNNPAHQKIVDWIVDNSEGAVSKDYVKYKEVEGAENGKLLRIFTPRFFVIKEGKIVDCFMTSSCGNIKGESEVEKRMIESQFRNFILPYMATDKS